METAIIYIYIVVLHPLCEAAPWSATMHTKFVALYENGLQDELSQKSSFPIIPKSLTCSVDNYIVLTSVAEF